MTLYRMLGLLGMAALAASFAPSVSRADSWPLPKTETYNSAGGGARVIVTPRALESQLAYFEDKVAEAAPARQAGQKKGGAAAAVARVERRLNNRWEKVWEEPIANEVAPVSAIVRDDGRYVATFDDWHATGYGPNVVAIYGPRGERVHALALSDILPVDYVDALPHSVSSIAWRGEPRFSADGARVVIPIVIPSDSSSYETRTVELAVDVADGKVSPVDADAWRAALSMSRTARAAQAAAGAAATADFTDPLLGPQVNTARAWHIYLHEAVARLVGDQDPPTTRILWRPGEDNHDRSKKWIHEALTETDAANVALASLSEQDLVPFLETLAAQLPSGSLAKVTVFLAVSDRTWLSAVRAMESTGAKLIQLDPGKPIPQRPERIARRYASDKR